MDRINAHLEFWRPLMGLDRWDFGINFELNHCELGKQYNALVGAEWSRQQASIRFFLPMMNTQTDEETERTVVHELCHCMVNPMENKKTKDDSVEYVVAGLTRAFILLKGKINPRKTLQKT